jgi:TolA-binding protein
VPPPSTPDGAPSSAGAAAKSTTLTKLVGVVVALGVVGVGAYALSGGGPEEPAALPAPAVAVVEPTPDPEPELTPPEEPNEEPAEIETATAEPESEPEPEPAADPTPPSSAKPSSSPDDLFSRANAARRARDYDDAIRLYQRLQKEHRGSREAQVSRVALGRLLLDERDRPKQALRLFDAYLKQAPTGSLAEEATAGRALALGKLGKNQAEREAWEQLLHQFPGSAYAKRARARLGSTPD